MNVRTVEHRLARHVLTGMRDKSTGQVEFRKGLVKLGRICGYDIIDKQMKSALRNIETPLTKTVGEHVVGLDNVVIINVLRAATHLVEGLVKAFPSARQGVISASRNEEVEMVDGKFPITIGYTNIPSLTEKDTVIVADPMLATGSTMCKVLQHVLENNPDPAQLIVLSIVSANQGLEAVSAAYPQVQLWTVAVDDHLDERGYIVPGLGDAGDRAFGA